MFLQVLITHIAPSFHSRIYMNVDSTNNQQIHNYIFGYIYSLRYDTQINLLLFSDAKSMKILTQSRISTATINLLLFTSKLQTSLAFRCAISAKLLTQFSIATSRHTIKPRWTKPKTDWALTQLSTTLQNGGAIFQLYHPFLPCWYFWHLTPILCSYVSFCSLHHRTFSLCIVDDT
jgi:hypothetical protein